MNIVITKDFMYEETNKILKAFIMLQEVEQIQIKGIVISSLEDSGAINDAINKCFHDIYSDVDIEIKIKLNQDEYNSKSPIYADNLKRIGVKSDLLGMSHYCTEERGEVIRLCKVNGMKFDLIITATYEDKMSFLPHFNINQDMEKVNDFWFIAIQALGKLMRKDYLISSHLTHMLVQEGLVLQMLIRDKEKGTNFHRSGYAEELDYLTIYNEEEIMFSKTLDETYNYISRLLYSAVKSYDRLSFLLDNSYKGRLKNFLSIWEYYVQDMSQ